jgi:aspartate ammonia-lyase
MSLFRKERDLLGERDVPAEALHGIHTERAVENFPLSGRRTHPALVRAFGAVKLACARTNRELGAWEASKAQAIEAACADMMEGRLDSWIVVDALQGGAGTSTNMNVNEVLANRALQLLGKPPGDYETVSPLDDINRHQSTNDTYPTALKVAAIQGLRALEREVVALLEEFQRKEKAFAHIVKIGRTEMQDAVLVTLGREMGAYAEAFARDRWRIYKCEERLRVVNLGGTAVGTGLGAPRQFIFHAVERLRDITGLGLARAENLMEATQNVDVFVEVSGILKACAANLIKVSGDLRFMSSGPDAGIGELRLPERQAGSSIMPGKVNPVIPEAATQAAMAVIAHDAAITQACAAGHMELNPFLPLIADALLDSLDLLRNACHILRKHCVEGLAADEERCRRHVANATAGLTALIEKLGYKAATELAAAARAEGRGIREVAVERKLLTAGEYDHLTAPESVMRLGHATKRPPGRHAAKSPESR